MSNEEFQRLVLEKLGKLDARLDKLEKRMDEITDIIKDNSDEFIIFKECYSGEMSGTVP